MPTTRIRDAHADDAAAIAAIYNAYVRETVVTFEVTDVAAIEMAGRIADVRARDLPWLVLDLDGVACGYAYAAPWKPRAAYARSVETSIYLDAMACGRGWGRQLYAALLARLRAAGVHVAIAGMALPNPASERLHAALGFAHVGVFREVGFKRERWVDVGYWHMLLQTPP